MNFGFFTDQDTTRYCYLRLRRLKAAIKDATIVDALAEELEVPGATAKNDSRKKLAAIERRIEELRATKNSLWHEVAAPEVLAASIFKARKRTGEIDKLFGQVPRMRELATPLVGWLRIAGLTPHQGGAPGMGRANVIGYRGGGLLTSVRIVGIEAINDAAELKLATDDTKTARDLSHVWYIACTPATAAAYLWEHAMAPGVSRWDAQALDRKLRASGSGLLIVEGEAVAQAILPKETKPDSVKLAAFATAIQSTIGIQK